MCVGGDACVRVCVHEYVYVFVFVYLCILMFIFLYMCVYLYMGSLTYDGDSFLQWYCNPNFGVSQNLPNYSTVFK